MTHHPSWAWLIDWADDRTFGHAAADVSDDVATSSVLFGSRPDQDPGGLAVGTAIGDLILTDRGGRLRPDAVKPAVPAAALRSSHAAELRIDGTAIWSGVAEPAERPTRPGAPLTWHLSGAQHETLVTPDRLLDVEPADVAGLARDFAAASGVQLLAGSTQPVGQVLHRGSWLFFLQDFARFAGGFVLERRDGEFVFRAWSDLPTQPLSAALTLVAGPTDDSRLGERAGWVRNHVRARGLLWEGTDDALIAVAEAEMGPSESRWVPLVFEGGVRARPDAWTGFAVDDTTNFELVGSAQIISDVQRNARVRSTHTAGRKTVRVTATGTVERRREATGRDIDIADSQARWGNRSLSLPPWFPSDLDGTETWTTPWLRAMASAPEVLVITWPLVQPARAGTATLRDQVQPGNTISARIVIDGAAVTVTVVVVAVRISVGGRQVPALTAWGVVIPTTAVTPPLTARVVTVTDTTAAISVGTPSPAGQTIHGRRRTAGPPAGAWTAITAATATTEQTPVELDTLTADTLYDAQFSLDAGFAAAGRADVSWRTLEAQDRRLASVRVNGSLLTGWDFTADDAHSATVTLSTTTGTVTVTAATRDATAQLVITPATTNGARNGDTITVTLKVSLAAQTRTYTLTLTVSAPVLGDIAGTTSGGAANATHIWTLNAQNGGNPGYGDLGTAPRLEARSRSTYVRDASKDIPVTGLASAYGGADGNSTHVWVETGGSKLTFPTQLRCWRLSDGTRDAAKDWTLDLGLLVGHCADDTHIFVLNGVANNQRRATIRRRPVGGGAQLIRTLTWTGAPPADNDSPNDKQMDIAVDDTWLYLALETNAYERMVLKFNKTTFAYGGALSGPESGLGRYFAWVPSSPASHEPLFLSWLMSTAEAHSRVDGSRIT